MNTHITIFNSTGEYNLFKNSENFKRPNISYIKNIDEVYYSLISKKYLKFTSNEDNSTISLTNNGTNHPFVLYSEDLLEWHEWDYNALTLNSGESLYFCGVNENGFSTSDTNYSSFTVTGNLSQSGELNSLLTFDIESVESLPNSYCFYNIFENSSYNIDGPDSSKYNYLTFESLEDNNIIKWNAGSSKVISWSSDMSTWTSVTATSSGATLTTLNAGDKIYIKGTNTVYGTSGGMTYFTSTAKFKVSGNIMSLISGDNFTNNTTLTAQYALKGIFYSCTKLIDASNLILPATTLTTDCYCYMFYNCTSLTTAPEILPTTTLAQGCYKDMFSGCTSLTTAPELPATTLTQNCYSSMFYGCKLLTESPQLPATTLAQSCYSSMFYGCTALTSAPQLPATTLANYCYSQMFYGCTSLITAPELPATTLSQYCYQQMFSGCTSLTEAPELPVETLANYCYAGMFYGCMALTKAPELPATTLVESCYRQMFYGCTSLTEAPELPATTLAQNCYYQMLRGCTSLTTAPELPATTLAQYCYDSMFQGCTSLTTAPELPATTLAENCYYCMFGNTSLTEAPELPATTLADHCYSDMFNACASLTTVPELPATTLASYCYGSMFAGCTSLTEAPELPATTLAQNCYNQMFYGCTSLTTAPELPATTLANYCYNSMFYGCTALIKAPELPATTLANSCYSSMFRGCTSLTDAPVLPALTLVSSCYYQMFYNCSQIRYIKCLATDISASSCTSNWVYGLPNQGTFINDPSFEWPLSTTSNANGKPLYFWSSFNDYFTIYNNYGSVYWRCTSNSTAKTIYYSTNKTTWTALKARTDYNARIGSNSGGQIFYIKSENTSLSGSYFYFSVTGSSTDIYVYGNIMSLVYGDNFADKTTLPSGSTYTFSGLFRSDNTTYGRISVYVILPATTLTSYCYNQMFYNYGSNRDIKIYELPATTLTDHCYYQMFYDCKLLTAPELPATILASDCYGSMFYGCTSLTTPPELPATTLANSCYSSMFSGCKSLTKASELPATTLAQFCYSYMFSGCTSLTTAPELPATTLVQSCYSNMFYNCSNLNYIKCLATDISASGCLSSWVYGVASYGVFAKDDNINIDYGNSGIPYNWKVIGNTMYETNKLEYLTIESLSDSNTIKWKASNSSITKTISYSTDKITWTSIISTTGGATIATLNTGDKIYIKGTNNAYANSSYYNYFVISNTFKVSGNIMSLIYEDDFIGKTTLTAEYTFRRLFYNCNKMTDCSELILPATVLTDYCYYYMFYGCSSLIIPLHILPAETLSQYCYGYMFSGCTALTATPAILAKTCANYCYSNMFRECTSLTTAPVLPATTLANYCYQSLFYGCTSLTTTPELPATTLAQGCYQSMFYNCTSLIYTPVLPATTLVEGCYYNMFYGCTSLTTAPELPATTLAIACYQQMFYGCTSLTTAPQLPATTLVQGCYQQMFYGCTSLTTAPQLPATTLVQGCYQQMFYGCSNLNYIQMYAIDISANNCLTDWVKSVAATGTFVKNRYSQWPQNITSPIPIGWEIQLTEEGFYIESLSDNNTITWKLYGSNYTYRITVFSPDFTIFNTYTATTDGVTIATLNIGDKIYIKGNAYSYASSTSSYTYFTSTNKFNVGGNIMSLIYGDNFIGKTTLSSNYTFSKLFTGCTNLIDASNLILPATSLASNCYSEMFYGCTSLTTVPELPATTLANSCYTGMFSGCTSLTTTPELPATILAQSCYSSMFYNCTSLTTAPELPATTLANSCYFYMFRDCTSLTTAPELPATILAQSCYNYMFFGCSSLNYIKCLATDISASACTNSWVGGVAATGTFVKAYSTSWSTGVSAIPTGWTIENNITTFNPTINITPSGYITLSCSENNSIISLVSKSTYQTLYISKNHITWQEMVSGDAFIMNDGDVYYICGNLINDNDYSNFTNIILTGKISITGNCNAIWNYSNLNAALKESCGYMLFAGSTGLLTAPELPTTTLGWGCYQQMFYNCTSLTTSPELPATTLTDSCYYKMFYGCESLTTAPQLPAITLAYGCYYQMFYGCESLTTAPDLLATYLPNNCYIGMFSNCTSLNHIKMLGVSTYPNNSIIYDCLDGMLDNVALTGTFIKHIGATWDTEEIVPENWTIQTTTYTTFDPTISITPSGYITLTCSENNSTILLAAKSTYQTLYISKNHTTWQEMVSGDIFSMNNTDVYYICGNLTNDNENFTNIILTGKISITGNCNSIWNCSNLNATLKESCGYMLFGGSTGLLTAPSLPATTLAYGCYECMFANCTSLTAAPVLPATALADYCYSSMFSGCTSLTSAPQLPATTLAYSCYSSMFEGCTSLTTAPELPAITLAQECYYSMFQNCTSLTIAPDLPAIIGEGGCYSNMFNNCTSLCYVKCMLTNPSYNYTDEWLYGVSETGIFIESLDINHNYYSWSSWSESGIPGGWIVNTWDNPLILVSLDDNNLIKFNATDSTVAKTISYLRYGDDIGTSVTATTSGATITTLTKGDVIAITGDNMSYGLSSSSYNYFSSSGRFIVFGNIASLFYGFDYSNYNLSDTSGMTSDEIPAQYTFTGLFKNCTNLIDAESLCMPMYEMETGCYESMFQGCTSLKAAPKFIGETVAASCYKNMFQGCTVLTKIPELPAKTLADSCYYAMFKGCTAITTSPVLPASTLVNNCYYEMFNGCTLLNTIKCNATNISTNQNYTTNWVSNVSSTGTFYKNLLFIAVYGVSAIPTNWAATSTYEFEYLTIESTSNNNVISISYYDYNALDISWSSDKTNWTTVTSTTSGTTLTTLNNGDKIYIKGNNNYYDDNRFSSTSTFNISGNIMSLLYGNNFIGKTSLNDQYYNIFDGLFSECTNLVNAANLILPTTALGPYCYSNMFRGCTSLTTAPALPATTLTEGCYSGMFYECESLTTAPVLPATTLEYCCYSVMFYGCTSLTTAPLLPATTLAEYCYDSMFYGCTSLTTPPSLPATSFIYNNGNYSAYNCYDSMFAGCTSLTTAPTIPATTLVGGCYQYMFQGCESLAYIQMLATDISASNCLYAWTDGVANSGTFVKADNMNDIPVDSIDGIPSGWTVYDKTVYDNLS